MDIRLYNINMKSNGEDRLLFQSSSARDSAFESFTYKEYECSNFERVDDFTFHIDVYKLPKYLMNYNYAVLINNINGLISSNLTYWNEQNALGNAITLTEEPSAEDIAEYPLNLAIRLSQGTLPESYLYFKIISNDTLRYYTFIESAVEKNKNETRLILNLDTITQYFNITDLNNNEVFVDRTHLDRFTQTTGTTVYPRFDSSDELLIKEDFNIKPSIIAEGTCNFYEFTNGYELKWISITVKGGLTKYNEIRNYTKVASSYTPRTSDSYSPTKTYYMPYYKKVKFGGSFGSRTISLLQMFECVRQMGEEVIDVEILPYLAIKQSTADYNFSLSFDTTNNEVVVGINSGNINDVFYTIGETNYYLMTNLIHGETNQLIPSYSGGISYHKPSYSKTSLATTNVEPKIMQFQKYILCFMQEVVDIPFDLLKGEDIVLKVRRGIGLTNERYDFFLESGYFNNYKNTGATLSQIGDFSIPRLSDSWFDYVSQHKASSRSGFAYGQQAIQGSVQTAVAMTYSPLQASMSLGNTIMQMMNTKIARDDLKQAPDKLRHRGSNVYTDIGTEYTFNASMNMVDITYSEKKQIETYLFYNGYKYNRYKKISDLIESRQNFNYIKTMTNEKVLSTGISENIMNDITERLNSGIRFYHGIDKIQNKSIVNNERWF